MTLDPTDTELLSLLQQNAQLTAEALGQRLNLSASQVGRRRQRLESEGYVLGYRARLDPNRLGLSVQAFVHVSMASHAPELAQDFSRLVEGRREIISAWTLTGEADYLLRVFCGDLTDLNRLVHDVLMSHPAVARVHSQIVMDQFKADAPLPM